MDLVALAPVDVPDRASALVALQRAAYAVEAAIIGDDRIPGLRESRDDLVAAGLDWRVALEGDLVVGALASRTVDGGLDVDRLVVAPSHHRRGVASRLLSGALAGVDRAVVSTGRANLPARALYERHGFVHAGDREVLPGLWVSDYAWSQDRTPPTWAAGWTS